MDKNWAEKNKEIQVLLSKEAAFKDAVIKLTDFREELFPLAVYNDDVLVGFVMIGKGTVGNEEESDLIKENYSVWKLMIDKGYQGQGLGKQTTDAVIALIRTFPFGEAKKVWLSYEPENTRARAIYQRYGFVENGEMCGNEIVAVYEL